MSSLLVYVYYFINVTLSLASHSPIHLIFYLSFHLLFCIVWLLKGVAVSRPEIEEREIKLHAIFLPFFVLRQYQHPIQL